jgi:HK97 family phage prohead protease
MTDDIEARRQRIEVLKGTLERRNAPAPALASSGSVDGDGVHVWGYGSTFATAAEPEYPVGNPERNGFWERIGRTAFNRVKSENPDVVLNIGHGQGGSGLPLARTKSGTLRLSVDDTGLRWEATLDPSDPEVQSLLPKLRRGDVTGASFGFRVTSDVWSDDMKHREITGISMHQGDCSIVDFGANPGASTQLRASSPPPSAPAAARDYARYMREEEVLRQARANGWRPKRTAKPSQPTRTSDPSAYYDRRLEEIKRRIA